MRSPAHRIPSRRAHGLLLAVTPLLLLLLAGCATPARPPRSASPEQKLGDAVVAPLTDLNLVRAGIPAVLAQAQQAPYAVPAEVSCATLGAQVEALDAALGPDLDATANAVPATLVERGTEAASDAVIGAVRSTTEGVIPFRGWVRKLSGAERHAKDVAAAIAAGTIRRAYLKGIAQAGGCPPPAAPLPPGPRMLPAHTEPPPRPELPTAQIAP
jgi:hypothetical protein